ncbi:MAG: hypothetical protein JSS78_09325 [Bacteroidetes bacterium]|nr:hypothetical protein [Bacteroidota bacterium]
MNSNVVSLKIKKFFLLVLLIVLSAIFLFSGISKLYDFERFEWNIMDAGISSMILSGVLARLFIGLELMLGLFLLLHLFLKTFTYKAVFILLSFFTVYLIALMVRQGNSGNCGCFGEMYHMTPGMGIAKNAVMMIMVVILLKGHNSNPFKQAPVIAAIAGMISIVIPFVFFPLSQDSVPEISHETINLEPLYHSKNPENTKPVQDLRTGKHIVAFMSLTCPHCKKAAFVLQIIHRQNPDIPIFFVLNGNPDFLSDFYKESQADSVSHVLFRGSDEFASMAGSAVPAIYFIHNSVIERKANYFQLDPQYMRQWLREP